MNGLVIGRIVHYHAVEPVEDHPAIITHVLKTSDGEFLEKGTCNLTVFTPWGNQLVTANYGTDAGEWSWPDYDRPEENKDTYHESGNMEPTPPEEAVG